MALETNNTSLDAQIQGLQGYDDKLALWSTKTVKELLFAKTRKELLLGVYLVFHTMRGNCDTLLVDSNICLK